MRQPNRVLYVALGLSLSLSLSLLSGITANTALAQDNVLLANKPAPAAPASGVPDDPFKDLKNVERRFFFHSYDHDPIDKRLERIELLVFGGIQNGENTERLQRIRSIVAKRDREAAQQLSEKNHSLKPGPKAAPPSSSAQYPILQTLEWRVLKKTFAGESLDQRLDRLETSLLGQPSPAMSYADRVERLGKITGIGGNSPVTPPVTGLGPRVKAGKRSNNPIFSTPYLPPGFGGDDESTFEEDFEGRMNHDMRAMMEHMQRMMQDMPEARRGTGGTTPFGRGFMIQIPDGQSSPYMVPNPTPKKPKIPPYADPNSI